MAKKGGGTNAAEQARRDEQERQARIRAGTKRIDNIFAKNFTPDFFAGRQQAYLDYATPQLNDQYADASKKLAFALSRSGMLDSSVRGSKAGELQKLYDTQRQNIADQALSYKTQAQSAIEDARSDLIRTLNATGDAEGAAQSAINRAAALSQPVAFSPLGRLFADFTYGLGVQAAAERAAALSGGMYRSPYTIGLYNPGNPIRYT